MVECYSVVRSRTDNLEKTSKKEVDEKREA